MNTKAELLIVDFQESNLYKSSIEGGVISHDKYSIRLSLNLVES